MNGPVTDPDLAEKVPDLADCAVEAAAKNGASVTTDSRPESNEADILADEIGDLTITADDLPCDSIAVDVNHETVEGIADAPPPSELVEQPSERPEIEMTAAAIPVAVADKAGDLVEAADTTAPVTEAEAEVDGDDAANKNEEHDTAPPHALEGL